MSEASLSTSPALASGAPTNPFILTESFRTGDKIFGRDGEIVDFVTRLFARRIVLLHSPSGAGKTSLLSAGLIPALIETGFTEANRGLSPYSPSCRIAKSSPQDDGGYR